METYLDVEGPLQSNCVCWFLVKQVLLTHVSLNEEMNISMFKMFYCGTNKHLFLYCRVTNRHWQLF